MPGSTNTVAIERAGPAVPDPPLPKAGRVPRPGYGKYPPARCVRGRSPGTSYAGARPLLTIVSADRLRSGALRAVRDRIYGPTYSGVGFLQQVFPHKVFAQE